MEKQIIKQLQEFLKTGITQDEFIFYQNIVLQIDWFEIDKGDEIACVIQGYLDNLNQKHKFYNDYISIAETLYNHTGTYDILTPQYFLDHPYLEN